jgi:hypothetical protein
LRYQAVKASNVGGIQCFRCRTGDNLGAGRVALAIPRNVDADDELTKSHLSF